MELERSSISLRRLASSCSGTFLKIFCSSDQYHTPRQGVTAPYTTMPGLNGQWAVFMRTRYGWPFTRLRTVMDLTSSPSWHHSSTRKKDQCRSYHDRSVDLSSSGKSRVPAKTSITPNPDHSVQCWQTKSSLVWMSGWPLWSSRYRKKKKRNR